MIKHLQFQFGGRFLIYGLTHPVTGELRYVGKSTQGLRRPKLHICPSLLKADTHKTRWIKTLLSQGLVPGIVVLEELPTSDGLPELEKLAIARFRSEGVDLVNTTDGGDGTSGLRHPHSEETKAKISASHIGVSHPNSASTREKMSLTLKGRVITAEHRAKISAAMKGRTFSEEHKKKISESKRGSVCSRP